MLLGVEHGDLGTALSRLSPECWACPKETRLFLRSPWMWGGAALAAALCTSWGWRTETVWNSFTTNAGMAGAAVAARAGTTTTTTAAAAGPATQGALLVGTLFPSGTPSPWLAPGAGAWDADHHYWLPALPVPTAVLLAANRDLWPLRRMKPVRDP